MASSQITLILEKLAEPEIKDFARRFYKQEKFKNLQTTLHMIHAIIQEQEQDVQISDWISSLKEAAIKAEYLLQRVIFANHNLSLELGYDTLNALNYLETVAEKGLCLKLMKLGERKFSSYVNGKEIIGREGDIKKIKQMLNQSSETPMGRNSSVISIVGPPGIGKTTLAKLIWGDDEVGTNFDSRIWISAPPNFEGKTIIRTIIEALTETKCELEPLATLHCMARKLLSQKSFLLVVDDVWTIDVDEWNIVHSLLRGGRSKILATTCSKKVALYTGNVYTSHQLKGLSTDDCWDIFRKCAFSSEIEEKKYSNLQKIGKELVLKCGGIPLAAKILGDLMLSKRKESEWLHVLKCDLWDFEAYRRKFLPVLFLSYMHLPLHVKECFTLCSVLQKNYEIQKEELIHMWMESDLIPQDRVFPLEVMGGQYFDELLWMFVFEGVEECESGCIRGYKMNQGFHSLARFISEKIITTAQLEEKTSTKLDIPPRAKWSMHEVVRSLFDSLPWRK